MAFNQLTFNQDWTQASQLIMTRPQKRAPHSH